MEITSINTNPEDFITIIKQDIQTLRDNIKTERSLADQISNHCAIKAVLEEKINASEAALQEARQSVAAAQDIESTLKQKIVALELEAVSLREQPHESPEILGRLRDIGIQNEAIQQEIQTMCQANTEASMLLQEKFEDYSHLQLRLEDVDHHLAEERAKATQVTNEHTAFIKHLNGKQEGEKADLVAKFELDRNLREAEHRAEVEKCKDRVAFLEARISEEEQASGKLRQEKAVVDELTEKQLNLLTELQKSKDAADNLAQEQVQSLRDEVENLRIAAAALELRKEESDTKVEDIRHSFRKCISELKEAKARITELEVENTKRTNETREANEARQIAEDLLAMQTRRATEAHKALEDFQSLNGAQGCTESAGETQQDENGGPRKPRRKADRSNIQSFRRIVNDSQLQLKSDSHEGRLSHRVPEGSQPGSMSEPLASNKGLQTTKSSRSNFSFAPEETTEDTFDGPSSFEDLFPRTPNTGSQTLKPTVSFVEDSFGPTNQLSPSEDCLASDFLEVDLEYLPLPEKTETPIMPRTPRDPPAYSQTATVSPQNLALTDNVANYNNSQATRTSGPPKGILKTGRSMKRTADNAGLTLDSARTKGNGIRSESQNLGPAIPDSQARSRSQGTPSKSHSFGSVPAHSQSQTRVTLSKGRRGRPAKTTAARSKSE